MDSEVRPDTSLERLLGGKAAAKLEKAFGLSTAGELLDHYPRRYIEYGQLSSFIDLREDEHVTFIAQVLSSSERRMQRRRGMLVEVIVEDIVGGRLKMAFFQGWNARRQLTPGVRAMFHGKVGSYAGELTLNNPEFTVLAEEEDGAAAQLGEGSAPVPLYPAKSGLTSWEIHRCIQILLDLTEIGAWPDPLPESVRSAESLPSLAEAYRMVHRPEDLKEPERGLERLRFQEAFMLQALLTRRRQQVRQTPARPRPASEEGLRAAFDAQLPFAMTPGQRRCGELIAEDLAGAEPMNRLLQGEVGSGKTLVALRAMLHVADSGGQAALIAPTEVLAAQHERSLRRMLGPLCEGEQPSLRLTLLTGSMSTAERKKALLDIASGSTDLVVGTHAVLGEQVHFADLGLVVIDEQHRFGVEQRNALRTRYESTPHMLVMSATPIPRSVAMTAFGDLELTVLEGLPGGRQPIETHLAQMTLGPRVIGRVWERIAEEIAQGHQVYVVCPKITQKDSAGAEDQMDRAGVDAAADASVELMGERLAEHPLLKDVRQATVHGRMDPATTEQTMRAFERGEIDLLISTTVIEVGVDVPNATVMAILDADAFGISTLHQLRGRVGRGSAQGLCLLVTRLPEGHPSLERLREVASHSDGMQLAKLDLERRREGDILGASQAGRASSLKLLRVSRHEQEIARAAEHIRGLTEQDPGWQDHPALRETVDAWLSENERAEEFIQHG